LVWCGRIIGTWLVTAKDLYQFMMVKGI
jgi:hypothetical protein